MRGATWRHAKAIRFLPFEDSRLNTPLPHGGLKLGALHEFLSDGLEAELAPAVTAFVATAAAKNFTHREGYALWALSRADCYAPGLARFGLEPSRIVWVECRKDAEVLGVMEEALHSRALAAVVGEAGTLSLKAGRRLDAAARQSDVTALLLRRPLFKSSKAGCGPSGAAATRWRVCALPTADRDRFSPHPVLLPPSSSWRVRNRRRPHPLADAENSLSGNLAKARLRGEGWGEGAPIRPRAALLAARPRILPQRQTGIVDCGGIGWFRRRRTLKWAMFVWLPNFAMRLARLKRPRSARPHEPLALLEKNGNIHRIAALDEPALRAGLYLHQPLADALAVCPKLVSADAEPEAVQEALTALAAWAQRYSPATAPAPPCGLWLDITGCAHLWDGEDGLAEDLIARLEARGVKARAAIAPTFGAAYALAHHAKHYLIASSGDVVAERQSLVRDLGGNRACVSAAIPDGGRKARFRDDDCGLPALLAPLPVERLRIGADTAAVLRKLGLFTIGQVQRLPRAGLARRFPDLLPQLDKALGRGAEPIEFLCPPSPWIEWLRFAEPILSARRFGAYHAQASGHALRAPASRAARRPAFRDQFFQM